MAPVDRSSVRDSASPDDAHRCIFVQVTEQALDEALARRRVEHPRNGAVLLFYGVVRDLHEGRPVERVRYEAYVPMAKKEMRKIAEDAIRRWPVQKMAIHHRVASLLRH